MNWYIDEGLNAFIREWKKAHPGAVVYTIGDENHSKDPDISQHAPDTGGKAPGDDKGEVDAGDVMPGKGVTRAHLLDLFHGLRRSRDKRILYVIFEDMIFSSRPVDNYAAWEIRPYNGKFHSHVHLSVNDNFDNDQSDWKWEKLVAREIKYVEINGKIPELMLGDDAADISGFNHIIRAQALINLLDNSLPDLDIDGVYGAKTAKKLARVMKERELKTTTNGSKIYEPEWRTLYGLTS